MKIFNNRFIHIIIGITLILTVFLGSLITSVSANSQSATKGKWGDNITWNINSEGTLTLSGTGKMKEGTSYHYTSDEEDDDIFIPEVYPWIEYHAKKIRKIIIGEGIINISAQAFQNTNLEKVVFPTTLESIDEDAFRFSDNLTKVVLPNKVSKINSFAFADCSNLVYVKMTKVKTIGSLAFSNCKKLTSITLPQTVESIGSQAFSKCLKLENITFPNKKIDFGTEVFYGCKSLKKVILPEGTTDLVKAFKNCTSLEEVSIPSTATDLKHTFWGCTSLKKVTLLSDTTKLVGTFFGCTSLTDITIPSNVKSLESTFVNCTSLKEVKLSSNLRKLDRAFSGCSSLKKITLPKSVEVIGGELFYNCKNLKKIIFKSTNLDLTKTKQKDVLFKGINKDAVIILPNKKYDVYRIQIEPFVSKTVKIKNADGKSPKLNSYSTIESGKWGENIKWKIDKDGCLTISGKGEMKSGVGSYSTSNYYLKDNNRYPWAQYAGIIKKIIIKDGVTTVSQKAFYCPDKSVNDGRNWGNKYSKLKTVKLGSRVTVIEEGAFMNCGNLKKINLNDNITEIPNECFSECKKLEKITFPKSIKRIGRYAFKGCKLISKVTIPNKVEKIGNRAFYGCEKLKNIVFKTKKWKAQKGYGSFKNINPNATFKLPSAKFKTYKKAISKYAPETVKYLKY